MEIGLDRICPGETAVVTKLETADTLARRLRHFGMIPGTKVRCRYRSPGGSVTALELRGTVLALRTCDLRKIRVRC